jgi:AraC-like DNA-binding protein
MSSSDDKAARLSNARVGNALGGPQVVIDLPASVDGVSFTTWQSHLSFACRLDLVDPSEIAAFHASTHLYMLGQFIFSASNSSHLTRLIRSGGNVARSGIDHVNITLHLEGSYRGTCGGRAFDAQPGDVSFIDFGQPFDFETSTYRNIVLTVPRVMMPEALRQRGVGGVVPTRDRPATRLLAQMMHDVYAALPDMSAEQAVAAASAIVELSVGATADASEMRDVARPAELDLFGRAQALIERSLGSDLTVEALAAALNASRNALYAVFNEHGGVQAYIRERRLQRCYETINVDDRAGETIGAIAFSLGFRSEAHFSRAFKERFGVGPRDLRTVARERGVDMQPAKAIGVAPQSMQALGR